jgi:hypothetical protein
VQRELVQILADLRVFPGIFGHCDVRGVATLAYPGYELTSPGAVGYRGGGMGLGGGSVYRAGSTVVNPAGLSGVRDSSEIKVVPAPQAMARGRGVPRRRVASS